MDAFEIGMSNGIEKNAGKAKNVVRRIGRAIGIKKNVATPIAQLPVARPASATTAMGGHAASTPITQVAPARSAGAKSSITAMGGHQASTPVQQVRMPAAGSKPVLGMEEMAKRTAAPQEVTPARMSGLKKGLIAAGAGGGATYMATRPKQPQHPVTSYAPGY